MRSNGRPSHQVSGVQRRPDQVAARCRRSSFLHPRQPRSVDVERSQRPWRVRDMAGLAARCRTGIQHPLARLRVEQARRPLRAGILHRRVTLIEARQAVHRHRFLEGDSVRAGLMRGQPCLVQAPQIARDIPMAAIDAQGERRMQQAGFEDALPGPKAGLQR
jgi:hypothetical protein